MTIGRSFGRSGRGGGALYVVEDDGAKGKEESTFSVGLEGLGGLSLESLLTVDVVGDGRSGRSGRDGRGGALVRVGTVRTGGIVLVGFDVFLLFCSLCRVLARTLAR